MRLSLLALLLLTAPMAAEPLKRPGNPLQEEQPREVKRASAWPKLDRKQVSEVDRAVAKLKKASSEAMEKLGSDALIEFGPAAAPALLKAMGKEKKPDPRARLIAVLEKITDARHTRLLMPYFEHKNVEFRLWCLRRCAGFPDEGTRESAQRALKKALNPGKRKEVDASVVFAAALASCAAGDLKAMEHLYGRAKEAWKIEAVAIHRALTPLKGGAASRVLLGQLRSSERKNRLVALRFLSAAGTEEDSVAAIAPFLDEQDSELLIAAINALRSIVDHQPPLARLSAFDAITKGKEWKQRL